MNKLIPQISQKSLFRLASILYPNLNNKTPNASIISTMIQSVLAERENSQMSITNVVACILEDFNATVQHKEVVTAVKSDDTYFVITFDPENKEYISTINLSDLRYNEIQGQVQSEISSFFNTFATEQNLDMTFCKNSLSKYFFELTTTNINTFNQIINHSGNDFEDSFAELDLTVDISDFTQEEKEVLQIFFVWDNLEKKHAITSLVLSILEYCLFTNSSQGNRFDLNTKYELYLDTNIIFRALGINGDNRKLIILDFLKKAKQANIEIFISTFTSTEFFNTIDYYISEIVNIPRGIVYLGAYSDLSDYSIFDFYNDWRQDHKESNMQSFKLYIQSQFKLLLQNYKINPAAFPSLNCFSNAEKELISKYQTGINKVKREFQEGVAYFNEYEELEPKHNHDAVLIRGVESEHFNDSSVVRFIISSDKSLRYWDFKRQRGTSPFVLYPSHFMPFLMRICGRTDDDVSCFVKLISVKANKPKLSISQANIIIAAISSITEDLKNQKLLVSCVLENELQNEIKCCQDDSVLYEKIQEISKNYLEKEKQELEDIAQRERLRADEIFDQLESERNNYTSKIDELADATTSAHSQIKKQTDTIDKMVEDRIRIKHIWVTRVTPVLSIIWGLFCVYFFSMQLFFKDSSYNILPRLLTWCYSTLLGQDTGNGLLIFVNGFIIASLVYVCITWMPRIPCLFSPTKNEVIMNKMKQKEIDAITSLSK